MFKSVLCLNGSLPSQKTIKSLTKNIFPIVSADGAANKLFKKNIIPSYIIGDLDSIKNVEHFPTSKIIKVEDQNHTDFEKCLNYIKDSELFPVLVLGINGGEIDHIIGNLNLFIKYSSVIPMIFFDAPNKWGIAMDRNLSIKTDKENTISIFPFLQNTHLESKGLYWELNSDNHSIFQDTSIRNKTTTQEIVLNASSDKVLVITEGNSVPFSF